jgi:hypothetical protein
MGIGAGFFMWDCCLGVIDDWSVLLSGNECLLRHLHRILEQAMRAMRERVPGSHGRVVVGAVSTLHWRTGSEDIRTKDRKSG